MLLQDELIQDEEQLFDDERPGSDRTKGDMRTCEVCLNIRTTEGPILDHM